MFRPGKRPFSGKIPPFSGEIFAFNAQNRHDPPLFGGKRKTCTFHPEHGFFRQPPSGAEKAFRPPESCRIRQTLPEETDFSTEKTRRSKTPGQNHSFYPLLLVVPGPFSAFPARQKRLSRRRSHLSPHLSVSIQLILCLSAACHSALRGYSRKPRTPSSCKKRTVSARPIFFSSVLSAR